MSDWTSEYSQLIEDCEKREQNLTDWERGFVDSIKLQIAQGRRLSAKQIARLSDIWESATKKG